MIDVRLARAADAEAIVSLSAEVQALHAHALPELFKPVESLSFVASEVRDLLKVPDQIIFVATQNGNVVGYVSAQVQRRAETPFRRPNVALYVQFMGVRSEMRRRGIGRALVNAIREAASSREIESVLLDVWAFNSEARAFYEAVGFCPQRLILSLESSPLG